MVHVATYRDMTCYIEPSNSSCMSSMWTGVLYCKNNVVEGDIWVSGITPEYPTHHTLLGLGLGLGLGIRVRD